MKVTFRKTGAHRYAVIIEAPHHAPQSMDPAPGYDDHIPHDLVHYVVEAELGLQRGVFGRAAKGGGTFIRLEEGAAAGRARAREQRRQRRREQSLREADAATQDMVLSERLAAICDVAWRRRHGQRPDPSRPKPPDALTREDAARVERVVARLSLLAPMWNELPVGGELSFVWPNVE